jgi:hypothetical protein
VSATLGIAVSSSVPARPRSRSRSYRDDLRHELLQRTVQAAIDDPRPSLSGIEVKAQLRELADTPLPEAAIWRKIP